MTRIHRNDYFHLVNVLVRRLQSYYVHKFERYVATHELAV